MNRRELLIAAAAAPSPWRWPTGARASARGGTPLALVTADSEIGSSRCDLTDMRVVRSLAVPSEPHGIEAVDLLRAALVMSNESGTVTVLDATVPRVRRVLDGFQAPRYAAGDPRGRYAYVSDERAGQVIAIDVPRARVIGRVEVGKGARHISISPDGTRVITSLGSQAPRLALVDVTRPAAPAARAHVRRRRPRARRRLHPGRRARLDQLGRRPAPRGPRRAHAAAGCAPCPATHRRSTSRSTTSCTRVYVTSGDSGTLRTYRMADAKLLRTSRVTTGSYNVCALAGRVVTPSLDDGRLTLLDAQGPAQRAHRAARARRVHRRRRLRARSAVGLHGAHHVEARLEGHVAGVERDDGARHAPRLVAREEDDERRDLLRRRDLAAGAAARSSRARRRPRARPSAARSRRSSARSR